MMQELTPITVFSFIGISIISLIYFNYRKSQEVQKTIQTAIEKGENFGPDVIRALHIEITPKTKDYRKAVLFLSLGLSTFVFSVLLSSTWPDFALFTKSFAVFPIFLGAGYLVVWKTGKYD